MSCQNENENNEAETGEMYTNTPNTKPVGEGIEEFDDILEVIGSHGRYQKLLLYGSLVPITFILALLSYSSIFTLFIPDHFCSPSVILRGNELEEWKTKHIPIEGDEKFSSCTMYNYTEDKDVEESRWNKTTIACQNGWIFSKSDFESTIPTDNNWICEKDSYPTFVFTISSIGLFVGNMVFGPLADIFGRKSILFFSLILYMGFMMMSFFVPHLYYVFLGSMFMASIGFPMIYTLPPLLMAELCDNEYRAWTFTVGWVAWVFGMAIVPFVAYIARTWLLLGVSITAPGFLIFLLFPLFPESPRWLLSMGRVDEAAVILRRIAKINKTSYKLTKEELIQILHKIVEFQKEKEEQVLGFWTLFSGKRLALITCIVSVVSTTNSMIYEQITLNTPYMSGNQFLNFFVLAVVELPGSVLAGYLIGNLGRRWTPVIFGLFMGIVCLVAGLVSEDMSILIIICIILGKFAVSVTFFVIYVQTTELFPTPLRATGGAVASTIASIFGLLNPSVVYTGKYYSGAPYLVMSLISFIGCICASFLPETLRQHLPETIEDAEDFGVGNKYWSMHPDYDRKKRKSIRRQSEVYIRSKSISVPHENDNDTTI